MTEVTAVGRYLYTFAYREEEEELCRLEQRALFGAEAGAAGWLLSKTEAGPGRSPFMRQRLAVSAEGAGLDELIARVSGLSTEGQTFKVRYVKTPDAPDYDEQRLIERQVGAVIRGKADVRQPQLTFGVFQAGSAWLFGELREQEAVWLKHQTKPRSYSTALSTRMARAIVNIALPYGETELAEKHLCDPCCGIGTVLVEALSMGASATGSDLNPLAVQGARINLAHFGYPPEVGLHDISGTTGCYDAVVVDLPYNLCSVSPRDEQLRILTEARRLSRRAVFVTTGEIGDLLDAAGFTVTDQCRIPKGRLVRQVLLCE